MNRRLQLLAALAVFSATAAVMTACTPGESSGRETQLSPWSPPASKPLRLIDLDGAVGGAPLAPDAGVLVRWSAPELGTDWVIESTATSRVLSLRQVPDAAERARWLRLTLRPGGAERVVVEALVARPAMETLELVLEKAFRVMVLPIPADHDPDRVLAFSIPLREAAKGNWFDAAAPASLSGLLITASGDRPCAAKIDDIAFLDDRVALSGSPAATRSVEIDGVVRPAWMVADGAQVSFELDVPDGKPVLRWYDGAIGAAGPRTVAISTDGSSNEIRTARGTGSWLANELSLDAWAGRRISLTLATQTLPDGIGDVSTHRTRGIGVFGTPIISCASTSEPPPDVLVYLVDALRADRIGAWGHAAARTPQLDRLAGEGATFSRAISSSCWTKPAVVTLLTGIEPTTHEVGAHSSLDPLSSSVPVLQQAFQTAGWRTGSFTANPLASNLSRLERGFDAAFLPRSWAGRIGAFLHPTAEQLHESMLDWIDDAPDRPFFAYVHTLEVHQNGMPSNVGDGTERMSPYDRAVARADTMLGELLEGLDIRGRLDHLLLVFVSDHGESLGEHGILGHGQSLYQPEIHIPLILWSPGRIPAGIHDAPVALADVGPTLLDLAGLPPFADGQGSSLVPELRRRGSDPRGPVFSSHQGLAIFPETARQYSVVSSDGKKLLRVVDLAEYGYDLGRDPEERSPSVNQPGSLHDELEAWLRRQRASRQRFEHAYGPLSDGAAIDLSDVQSLRSLGYLP